MTGLPGTSLALAGSGKPAARLSSAGGRVSEGEPVGVGAASVGYDRGDFERAAAAEGRVDMASGFVSGETAGRGRPIPDRPDSGRPERADGAERQRRYIQRAHG